MNEQRFSPDTEGGEEPFNPYLARKSPDQILQERLESEGWQLAGVEHPCITKFTPEAKFEKQRERSDEDIEQEYLAKYGVFAQNDRRRGGERRPDNLCLHAAIRFAGAKSGKSASQRLVQ